MYKKALLHIFFIAVSSFAYGQVVTECPRNIGFESGRFTNWECSVGLISGTGPNFPDAPRPATLNILPTGPYPLNHYLVERGKAIDPFGEFSLNSPNGSNFVVRLGNEVNGRGAERISYTIDVPADVETYSIIFNYAVVFENPAHDYDEQPKFTAQVFDVTTNSSTSCGSFEFTAPGAGGGLPGFSTSKYQVQANAPIFYKPWAPVLVNLTEYRGHKIRMEFTTNDCSRGGHFGYAYIDFNENCSIPITGNVTCPEAEKLTLKVITGFSQYRWFDVKTDKTLGNEETLDITNIPVVGTKIGVYLTPFGGLGCAQTLYTTISAITMQAHDPPPDCNSVDLTTTFVTVGNSSDLTYTYWLNTDATRPLADPEHVTVGGVYYIKGRSSSGCTMVVPVTVTITKPPPPRVINPPAVVFPATIDVTKTFPHDGGLKYSYWVDKDTTIRLKNPSSVKVSGTYYIKAKKASDCFSIVPVVVEVLIPDIVIPNTFTPNNDGINDVFTVLVNKDVKIKVFRIYNRWGSPVFETTDITNYWNGLSRNTMVPVGVYYWVLEGETGPNKYRRSGSVTVLR